MSYRITYCAGASRKENVESQKKGQSICWIIGIAVILGALFLIPQVRTAVLPDIKSDTTKAITTFAEQVEEGQPIKQAFYAFCKEIIAGAELS